MHRSHRPGHRTLRKGIMILPTTIATLIPAAPPVEGRSA